MKTMLILSVAALSAAPAFAQQGGTYEAEGIVISNFLGEVELTNSGNAETTVTLTRGEDEDAPGASISFEDGVLLVRGESRDLGDEYDCGSDGDRSGYREDGPLFFKGKFHDAREANTLTISAPESVLLRIEDSIAATDIETVSGFDLETSECGRLEVGAVRGDTRFDISGVQDIDLGETQGFTADISGVVDITVGSVNGPVEIELNGVGDITIRDGRADPLEVDMSGVGDVSFGGHAVNPDLSMTGIGEISIDTYDGDLTRNRTGIGEISVNQAQ
ncbi:DUF2807 domain-containing protein [Euryhalocaulis caribicus]|uniref:DUF2807 domain-containing protein n=1 Tax=Euryhalocaulis caribicus TaxID=1161401 RepID=UPI0003AA0ECD|nr:DUF2807 domain-containing protein [Euryhalocaulis caribicus]